MRTTTTPSVNRHGFAIDYEELLAALRGCLNAIDALTVELGVFPPVEADRARDLLRRAEAAKRAAQAAEAA